MAADGERAPSMSCRHVALRDGPSAECEEARSKIDEQRLHRQETRIQMKMKQILLVAQVVVTASCGVLGSCASGPSDSAKCSLPNEFAVIGEDAADYAVPPRRILHRASGEEMVLANVVQVGDGVIGNYVALRLRSQDAIGGLSSEAVRATWSGAVEICQAMGLRLPTAKELIAASGCSEFCHSCEASHLDGWPTREWTYGGLGEFNFVREMVEDSQVYPFIEWSHCDGKLVGAAGCHISPDAGGKKEFRVAVGMRFGDGSSRVVQPSVLTDSP